MSIPVLVLTHERHELRLTPTAGARVLSFATHYDAGTWHWLRPAVDARVSPVDSACYPLVPFSNRVQNARFIFDGKEIKLPANFPPEPHCLHGIGWRRDWHVVEQGQGVCALALDHPGDADWPWALTSRQRFILSETGLFNEITVTNRSDRPMPAGLGLHPHFPAPGDTRVTAEIAGLLIKDTASQSLPERLDRSHPAVVSLGAGALAPRDIDTGLEGWTGTARLDWPQAGKWLRIAAPGVSRAVYYAPADGDFLCFEPVSHTNNALVRLPEGVSDGGIRILAPGEEMRLEMSLEVGEI